MKRSTKRARDREQRRAGKGTKPAKSKYALKREQQATGEVAPPDDPATIGLKP